MTAPDTGRWLIGERFTTGSALICRRTATALWPGEWQERRARLILTTVATCIACPLIARHPAILGTLAAGGWTLTALIVSRPPAEATEPDAPSSEEEQPETEPEQETGPDPDELADLLRELTGDRRGVHLKTLAQALSEEWPGRSWTTADVRQLVAAAGIRIRPGVRIPGVGNTEGVHRDDIPDPTPPPLPDPSPNVVAAGQSNNNNGNNGVVVERYEGGLSIIRMPGEGQHHTV